MENQPSPDEIMCPCSGTRRSTIARLFHEGFDLDAISRKTGALSGCAGCEWDIEHYLKTLNEGSADN